VSLFSAAERLAAIDASTIVLEAGRCLHSQDQFSTCEDCLSVCPVNAITPGKPPSLNTRTCQTCLACLPVCPVGAFHADDDVVSLLNCVTHPEGKTIELVCGQHPHPGTGVDSQAIGIRIHGCLAGLGTGALLTLAALGLEHILLRTDACRACKWQTLPAQIHDQSERANRLLATWDKVETVNCVDQIESPFERACWDAKNPPLSRRDLFRMLARQGQVAMARAMENGMTTLNRQPGRDRLRTLSAVSHLSDPVPGAAVHLDGFGFAALRISDSCTACGACARACPTEALHFEKNEQETAFTLSFIPQNCIGCDLCAHVCAPAAISINHSPSFEQVLGSKEPVLLATGELAHCERCKTLIAARPGVKLCPLCEYRRTHPFGSKLPPGMKPALHKDRPS
jgi:ferredoxin